VALLVLRVVRVLRLLGPVALFAGLRRFGMHHRRLGSHLGRFRVRRCHPARGMQASGFGARDAAVRNNRDAQNPEVGPALVRVCERC